MNETQAVLKRQSVLSESGDFGNGDGQGQSRTETGRSIHSLHGAKGGRPRVQVPPAEVRHLRESGLSWRRVARSLGIGVETARRLAGVGRPNTSPANAPIPSQNPGKGVL